jgi:flagellar protein FlgJ
MTILSATPSAAAARVASPAAAGVRKTATDPALGSLFQADLAKASAAGEPKTVAETAAGSAPEKSIAFVSRGSKSGVMTPTQQFESFVLRSFVEGMLPDDNSSYFGTGTAGKIWKSMLAEQLGDEMARDGGIGISEMLEKRGAKAVALDGAKDELKNAQSLATGAQALKGLGAL